MVTHFLHMFSPLIPDAAAQVFDGGGITEGLEQAKQIAGLTGTDLRAVILNILYTVLNFLALAAVVAIVAAGIFLIAGGGSDASKDRAKKIILYVVIGLIVILFARFIVAFVLHLQNVTP